ncbi:MAG: hypothetical protein ACI4Q6_04825 [Huintestinicola sp.]
MEILLVFIIVLVIMAVLGVSMGIITGIILGAAGLVLLVITGFFIYSAVLLAGTRKCTAAFSRIDKNPRGNFDTAYYLVEGKEYPNAFPCEVTLRKRIYRPDREVTVRLNEKKGCVFDGNGFTAAVVGIVFSLSSCAVIILLLIFGNVM